MSRLITVSLDKRGVSCVARMLDDGHTAEVRRVCTDGTYNACSMLLRAGWRAVKALEQAL